VQVGGSGEKRWRCGQGADPELLEGAIYDMEIAPLGVSILVCVSNGQLEAFGLQKFWVLYRDAGLSEFVSDVRQLTRARRR
jgi:hypothetical protein